MFFNIAWRLAGLILAAGAGGGLLASAQNALPGEPLYGLKKAAEKGSAMVMGQVRRGDVAAANLQLAAKRLEEIDIISRRNLAQNLPAAMDEYQTAKTEAKKEVAAMVKKNPRKAGEIAKQAARAMKEIDDREKQVYAVLGAEPAPGKKIRAPKWSWTNKSLIADRLFKRRGNVATRENG